MAEKSYIEQREGVYRVGDTRKPGQDILSTSAEISDCIPHQSFLVTSLVEASSDYSQLIESTNITS